MAKSIMYLSTLVVLITAILKKKNDLGVEIFVFFFLIRLSSLVDIEILAKML